MNRADLIREALLDAYKSPEKKNARDIINLTVFEEISGWVVARMPKTKTRGGIMQTQEHEETLRNLIDEGLKVHGFYDVVKIDR